MGGGLPSPIATAPVANRLNVHPFMDGSGLPGVSRPTHDMVHPHFRADQRQAVAKAEQVHVVYKAVVVCVVDCATHGKATANTGHVQVEALHGFIQTVLGGAPYHDIRVAQLLLVNMQKLNDDGIAAGSIPTYPEAMGLKNWADERVCHPVTACSTDAAAWSATRMELYVEGRNRACQRCWQPATALYIWPA